MPNHSERLLRILSFGDRPVPYAQALELQRRVWSARHAGQCPDTLLTLQHSPVYTIGKRGQESDFRISRTEVERRGAEVQVVPRGGQITFHGPGQLVAYAIFGLRSLGFGARAFVEALEDSMIDVAAQYGVKAEGRIPGRTGVWVGGTNGRKIGAVGVQISQGVSMHGIALNVTTDLSFFDLIVPCGVADREVTSLALETSDRRDRQQIHQGPTIPPVYAETERMLHQAIFQHYRFTAIQQRDGWEELPRDSRTRGN